MKQDVISPIALRECLSSYSFPCNKEALTYLDQWKLKHLKEQVKDYDCNFEHCHVDVLNFTKAEAKVALDSEEAVFNEHVNHFSDIIERLEQLEDLIATAEPVMPHASDKSNGRPVVRP